MIVAGEQIAVVVVKVKAGTFAKAPDLAILALAFPGPCAVTHHLETVLPHLPEVILIDIPLVHVAAHRGTAADSAVTADAGHLDTATAVEEMVAHLLLVFTQESFTGIADV